MGNFLADNPMTGLYVGFFLIFLMGVVVGSVVSYARYYWQKQVQTGEADNAG